MNIWTIQIGEPIPELSPESKMFRLSLLNTELLKRGHNITRIGSTFDHFSKKQHFNNTHTLKPNERYQITLLKGTPSYKSNISALRFANQKLIAKRFSKWSRNQPLPDLIFCNLPTLELCEEAVKHGKTHNIPTIIDIRDQWPDQYLMALPMQARPIAKFFLYKEYRRLSKILSNASAITAVANSYIKWASKNANKQLTSKVFPIGIPSECTTISKVENSCIGIRKKYRLHPTNTIATFCGSFGASYDLETVIKSFTSNQLQSAPIQLCLIGEGYKKNKLTKLANGQSNIVFTGWLSHSEIQEVYRVSSIGLCPYSPGAQQALPNKPFEYMRQGIPIVSSIIGDLQDIVESEGIGVHYNAGSHKDLTIQLRKLLEKERFLTNAAKGAKKLFENRYRSEKIYPDLCNFIEYVHGKHKTKTS